MSDLMSAADIWDKTHATKNIYEINNDFVSMFAVARTGLVSGVDSLPMDEYREVT